MIGILVENIKLNGGVEIVSKRLLIGFQNVKIPCRGFTFGTGDSDWIGLGDKYLFSEESIFDVIKTLKEYNIENLIIQLNGPYSKLAFKKFYKLLFKSRIIRCKYLLMFSIFLLYQNFFSLSILYSCASKFSIYFLLFLSIK